MSFLTDKQKSRQNILTASLDYFVEQRTELIHLPSLKFLWFIYDHPHLNIKGLVIKNTAGHVLFQHKPTQHSIEVVPSGGNPYIISQWPTMSQKQKDAYIAMIIAQINDDQSS